MRLHPAWRAVVALVLVAGTALGASLSSCGVISSPGYYALTSNLTTATATCLYVSSNDVAIDCNPAGGAPTNAAVNLSAMEWDSAGAASLSIFLKFNYSAIPAGATINQAILTLNQTASTLGSAVDVGALNCSNQTWSADMAAAGFQNVWNSCNLTGNTTKGKSSPFPMGGYYLKEWNVTNSAAWGFASGMTNLTLVLNITIPASWNTNYSTALRVSTGGGSYDFNVPGIDGFTPYLTVNYTTAGGGGQQYWIRDTNGAGGFTDNYGIFVNGSFHNVTVKNCIVDNFTLGFFANYSSTFNVNLDNDEFIVRPNQTVVNFLKAGACLYRVTNSTVTNSRFKSETKCGSYVYNSSSYFCAGLVANESSNITVSGNVINVTDQNVGAWMRGVSNSLFSNNQVNSSYVGVFYYRWVQYPTNNTVAGNTITITSVPGTSASAALYFSNAVNSTATLNNLYDNAGYGMLVEGSPSVPNRVFGNNFRSTGSGRCLYTSGAYNRYYSNTLNATGTSDALYLDSGAASNLLYDNYIAANTGYAVRAGSSTGSTRNNTLWNNTVLSNAANQIFLNRSSLILINTTINLSRVYWATGVASVSNITYLVYASANVTDNSTGAPIANALVNVSNGTSIANLTTDSNGLTPFTPPFLAFFGNGTDNVTYWTTFNATASGYVENDTSLPLFSSDRQLLAMGFTGGLPTPLPTPPPTPPPPTPPPTTPYGPEWYAFTPPNGTQELKSTQATLAVLWGSYPGLSVAVLETNATTGVLTNYSQFPSGLWTNWTIILSNTPGLYAWRVYVTNGGGVKNNTPVWWIEVTATAPSPTPTPSPPPQSFDIVTITCPSLVVNRPVNFSTLQYVSGSRSCGVQSVSGEFPNDTLIPPGAFYNGGCSDGKTLYGFVANAVGDYNFTATAGSSSASCTVRFQKANPFASIRVPAVPPWVAIAAALAGLAIARAGRRAGRS